WSLGFIVFSGFWPNIPPPSASAEEIARFFWDNTTGMRIGTVLMYFGCVSVCIWGASVAAITRVGERVIPVFTYAQLTLVGCGWAIGAVHSTLWSVASFRPDGLSPDVIRMLNDIGFFFLLWSVPIFSGWCVVVGISIMCDKSKNPILPRWNMYFNFMVAFMMLPGSLITFFHEGPFAFDGFFGFYIPLLVYGSWVLLMSWSVLSAAYKLPKQEFNS